ncbi:MAG: HEAT repeat domain-containing protein [Acidobacteria bacterium]|nr:HEAT repeat domain-containing protein [Acidobacteriota bacterium]
MGTENNRPRIPPGPKAKLLVFGVAFLMVLVPFLFWKGTWFGTVLSDQKIEEYLASSARPRDTQHALLQISEQIVRGQLEQARRWYPSVLVLTNHPVPEVRNTVAWLMGQDVRQAEFHQALALLVKDANPLVRRNAALALVRFADAQGRPELLDMLRPFSVASPKAGVLKFRLKENDPVDTGTLLARVEIGTPEPVEVRSLLPGFVKQELVEDGTAVKEGENILLLAPSDEQVWEALRALFLVGRTEDLELIQSFTGRTPHFGERIRQQARLTIEAIRKRGV